MAYKRNFFDMCALHEQRILACKLLKNRKYTTILNKQSKRASVFFQRV